MVTRRTRLKVTVRKSARLDDEDDCSDIDKLSNTEESQVGRVRSRPRAPVDALGSWNGLSRRSLVHGGDGSRSNSSDKRPDQLVDGRFNKGHKHPAMGRPPGRQNNVTLLVKNAILGAADKIGHPGRNNEGGLQGYLEWLAVAEPTAYASLLRRLLPQQVRTDSNIAVEVLASLRAKESPPRLINGSAQVIEHDGEQNHDPSQTNDLWFMRSRRWESDEYVA